MEYLMTNLLQHTLGVWTNHSLKEPIKASMAFGSSLLLAMGTSLPSMALVNPHFPSQNPVPTPSYSQTQMDYFFDITMGSEYGNATHHIRKWDSDLHISVHGTPTAQDLDSLETVVAELNHLIDPINLHLLPSSSNEFPPLPSNADTVATIEPANVNFYFVPYTDFAHYVPSYQMGNLGYAWIWTQDDTIYDATILISSVGINQTERSHLIREELTQSLGLLRDSYQYEDSIFFQPWTTTNHYSTLDETLVRMLYSSKIQPGMTRQAVMTALDSGV